MKRMMFTAVMYTVVTAVLLGVGYPLAVTAVARVAFPRQAAGQLIEKDGVVVGSRLLGQGFAGDRYFHGRPSMAGAGYDAGNSSGSNLGPTSKAWVDGVAGRVQTAGGNGPVPVDLVTASGSGLDPDITPAGAMYQMGRVAGARHLAVATVSDLVRSHTTARQFGLLGEPRVNVLELNLALDAMGR